MAGTCRPRRPEPSAGRRKQPSNRLVRAISALRSRKSTPADDSLAITTHREPRMRLPWRTPGGVYRRPPALPERPSRLPAQWAAVRRSARAFSRRPSRRRRPERRGGGSRGPDDAEGPEGVAGASPRPAPPCPIRAGRGSTIPRPPRPREREMMERRHDGGTAPSTRRRAGKTPRPVSPKDRHGNPHRVIAP